MFILLACGGAGKFPLADPLWRDPDRRPFPGKPEEYFSPFGWDAADQTVFRPLTRVFAVDPAGRAQNVNALDEVPNSSWFENRIGRFAMTPREVALGPCRPGETDPVPPWTVKGAKPNGANPGFMIKDAEGRRYLVKFDGVTQGPRATAADAIVSKLYHAAGFLVPCNQVVFFDRDILSIDPEATGEGESGDEEPLSEDHIAQVLDKAIRLPDGRYRASTSLFVPGKPIGPFTYQGTRDDDPNDQIPHEDRRELRGARLLAAWTNHFDSREQNTLATWIETRAGRGYVRHNIIDFGDCLGSIWEPPALGRRIGHTNYFDPSAIAADFFTFGIIERPWDMARFGPTGRVFGYYDVDSFDPEGWEPGYPNPAFSRMQEGDAAWMARILSQLSDAHLRGAVRVGRFQDEFNEQFLFETLRGRRDKILRRYLTRVSPLSHPKVARTATGAALCLRDLAVEGGVRSRDKRVYGARARGTDGTAIRVGAPRLSGTRVCVPLPSIEASPKRPVYVVLDVMGRSGEQEEPPVHVHLYALGDTRFRLVGLERPEP